MAAMENNNKTINVPHLRFPEFSAEWEIVRLGDVCKFFSGGTPSSTNKDFYDGDIPFIRSGEIHSNSTELYITEAGLNSSSAKIVEQGDLLLALYGATSGDIAISKIKGAINQAILCIRTNHDNFFLKSCWEKHCEKLLQTYLQGGQGNLSAEIVKSIKMSFPSCLEQKKISGLLSLIEERISTQKKIIEKYESLIRGLCQKLFCFDEYSTDYLGNICSITTGKLDANAMVMDGKYPFFTCAEEVFNIDNYAFDTEALLISGNGANLGYIHYFKGKFNAYQRTYVLDKFTIDINYIRLYLETFLKNRIEQEKNIGNTPYIVLGTLSKMKIRVPNIITQKKIVKTLISLKEKLSNERLALVKYEEQKKYLLSNLFI